MFHPTLPYTKTNGGVEVTDEQFRLAWSVKGWKVLSPQVRTTDAVSVSESEEDQENG